MIIKRKPELQSKGPLKEINGPFEYDPSCNLESLIDIKDSERTGKYNSRQFFKQNGFLIIKNIFDPDLMYSEVPEEIGQYNYYGSIDKYCHISEENQVPGSIARYNHPQYKTIHSQIRLKLESVLGEKLYNTYYYDRFYFPGQKLTRHKDRDSCEISVSVQISKTNKDPWPFCLETLYGQEVSCNLEDGWGLVYMGCDVEHWREPLVPTHNKIKKFFDRSKKDLSKDYHHQIFFHYVRANGLRSHFANDQK